MVPHSPKLCANLLHHPCPPNGIGLPDIVGEIGSNSGDGGDNIEDHIILFDVGLLLVDCVDVGLPGAGLGLVLLPEAGVEHGLLPEAGVEHELFLSRQILLDLGRTLGKQPQQLVCIVSEISKLPESD